MDLITQRRANPAFHPLASQTILALDTGVFAILRQSRDGQQAVLALHNVTDTAITVHLPDAVVALGAWASSIILEPYAVAWLSS